MTMAASGFTDELRTFLAPTNGSGDPNPTFVGFPDDQPGTSVGDRWVTAYLNLVYSAGAGAVGVTDGSMDAGKAAAITAINSGAAAQAFVLDAGFAPLWTAAAAVPANFLPGATIVVPPTLLLNTALSDLYGTIQGGNQSGWTAALTLTAAFTASIATVSITIAPAAAVFLT